MRVLGGAFGSVKRWSFLVSAALLVAPWPAAEAAAEPLPAGSQQADSIRYQFAIYYLGSPAAPPLKVLREQLQRLPRAPALATVIEKPPKVAAMHAEHNTKVQETYKPPSLEMLQRFGRGISREQAVALQRSQHALVMDFAHPASMSPAAYRASLDLTEQLARATGGLVWDEETREVFSADEWHQRRLEGWDGDTPDALKHTVIHAYKGDRLVRAITLGMAKFGLPDIVVEDFPWSSNRSVGNLINLLAQSLVEGGTVGPKGYLDLNLRAIRHADVRQSQLTTLKANSTALAPLVLVKGTPEAGDPDNRLAEIRFERAVGRDRYARQDALLGSLFGSEDSFLAVKHNEQLLTVSQAAKARLPALRDAFNKGMQPGDYVMVKAPFKTASGGQEWMWVEVTAWSGEAITGLLKNEPVDVPGLHGGQEVKVLQGEVFDYIHRHADGRQEGNETGKIIERMQRPGG